MAYKSDLIKIVRTEESIDFPKVVLIDNTNACNLRCSICDHKNMKDHRPIQRMDMGLYRKIINEIAEENPEARVWEIFFGDPFMCKDISERVSYAKEMGLKDVVLNSNGVLMTPERGRALVEAGLDAMYVGVDAVKAETYEQIRVGGNFEKTIANVLAYRDSLNKWGSPAQKLFVQFVISDINEDEVDEFKRFWTEQGVNVKIRPKISWAGLVEADNLRENKGIVRKPCYWVMQTINICSDGRVALCSADIHCRVPCGDVNESDIKQIWGGFLRELRAMHRNGSFDELPDICQGCRDWQSTYADFEMAQ